MRYREVYKERASVTERGVLSCLSAPGLVWVKHLAPLPETSSWTH